MNSQKGITGNMLKIIAAVSMLIDHAGVVLFPHLGILRIIGRLAFPIFAFMIAEGCAYTKNKLRYFLTVFLLGFACQIVYTVYGGDTMLGILITFSLSILAVYALQYLKEAWFVAGSGFMKRCAATALFLAVVAGIYLLNQQVVVDYGFWGCMAPVFASVFRKPRGNAPAFWEKLDRRWIHILMLGLCLILIAREFGSSQPYSLLAIPLLLAYSGERGKRKMKYFFYIFYPLHLALLEGISYLLH